MSFWLGQGKPVQKEQRRIVYSRKCKRSLLPKGWYLPVSSAVLSKREQYSGFQFLPLITETHCLPSSIFIEHLQCTRHNRTYRKRCPCSWGAYILNKKKYTSLKWYFCLVFLQGTEETVGRVSFGNNLAPSLFKGWGGVKGRHDRPFGAGVSGGETLIN